MGLGDLSHEHRLNPEVDLNHMRVGPNLRRYDERLRPGISSPIVGPRSKMILGSNVSYRSLVQDNAGAY